MQVVPYARIEKDGGQNIMKRFVYLLIYVLCLPSKYLIQRFISDKELCLWLCGVVFGVGITCLIHFFIIEKNRRRNK